jgi:hypothetical protein
MATYIIDREISITRQEADTADVVFTVPDMIDMSLYPTVKFQVSNSMRTAILKKSTDENSLAIEAQIINVPLLPVDTHGKSGTFRWELEISNANETITIGRGIFVVIPQLIR